MSESRPEALGNAPIYWYYPTGDAEKAEDMFAEGRKLVWLQGEEVIATATLGPRMTVHEPLLWEGDDA